MSDQNSKPNDFRDEDMLNRVHTAGAVSIPPHLFEQLYLSPKNAVDGRLRQTFGNPTPIGKSLLLSFSPPIVIQYCGVCPGLT